MLNLSSDISLWRLFISGGPLMWPILLCSLLALTIVIQRFSYYSQISTDLSALLDKIFECLRNNNLKLAMELCDKNASPATEVLKAGLLKSDGPSDLMVSEMSNAARFAVSRLEDGLMMLSTIGQIAPVLGFLGTVSGMASSFFVIQARAAAMNPVSSADVAGGVWQALIASAAGYVVAVPTIIAYRYFIARRDNYVLDMEKSASDLARFADSLRVGVIKGE